MTELDKLLYIIIALVEVKTSKYLSKTNEIWNKARGWKKKIHNSYVSFDIVTFAIYGKNNGNMVVGEIPEFFQFPKRDICISTARCKCTIHIFTYKGIKVVIRPNLSTWPFYFPCRLFFIFFFLTWSWIELFFKEILLIIINFCITMSEIELVFRQAERQCSGSLFSMLLFKKLYLMQIFNQYLYLKRMIHVHLLDTDITAWIE